MNRRPYPLHGLSASCGEEAPSSSPHKSATQRLMPRAWFIHQRMSTEPVEGLIRGYAVKLP